VQARGSHQEVASGKRLRFGRNWSEFLKSIDEERIGRAEESLKQILNVESLRGRSFIDIVSGRPLRSFRDYQASRGTAMHARPTGGAGLRSNSSAPRYLIARTQASWFEASQLSKGLRAKRSLARQKAPWLKNRSRL
jgi:hypothetical protein